ncbi:MAG TPA: tRNA-specific adenosine deaminase [Bacteroidetes bacterium]|nr:tRNA-specific adenosine deaminase [Bacteroidota bacterium]
MWEAIRLSIQNIRDGNGGPFACVVVKEGKIIARGTNTVTSTNDPTAHAEIVAIRNACKELKSFQLSGCEIYTSCEPCPMCLGAIYWARPDKIYYANGRNDAAKIGFDDEILYEELSQKISDRKIPTMQLMREEALAAFREWEQKQDKIQY